MGIVEFTTRFGLNSQTTIDNVFIDTSTIGKYELYPFVNGLSDHDAQLLILSEGEKKEKECHTSKDSFLRIYYSGFPLTQVKSKMNQNSCITPGIITSSKRKRELYKELQNNNNATLAPYYRG